jgi:hypothetical protein
MTVTTNAQLAELARDVARHAGRGKRRRAALGAAVALDESVTPSGAKKILSYLDEIGLPDLRKAAADLVDQLASQ